MQKLKYIVEIECDNEDVPQDVYKSVRDVLFSLQEIGACWKKCSVIPFEAALESQKSVGTSTNNGIMATPKPLAVWCAKCGNINLINGSCRICGSVDVNMYAAS